MKDWFTWDRPPVAPEELTGGGQAPIGVPAFEEDSVKELSEADLEPRVAEEPSLELSESAPVYEQQAVPEEKLAEVRTTGEVPQSPTPQERAQVRELFAQEPAQLDPETLGRAHEKAYAIESYFINTHVARNDWMRVRLKPADNLMADALEEANRRRMPHSLRQLGKFFYEMGKPPFNVDPVNREPTEVFFGRALRAMTEAEARGEDVSHLRGYLTNVKKDWFRGPFRTSFRR